MKKKILDFLPYVLLLAGLGFLGFSLCSEEWEMLYRAQEQSLFLPTRQFYETMTIYPGGTLQWLACWATQFFYNPATGVLLLCACWAMIVLLLMGQYKLRGWKSLLALLPVVMLMTAIVQTGYWLYYTKLQGYFFVPTLGVLLSLVASGIFRVLKTRYDDWRWLSIGRDALAMLWMMAFAYFGYIHMGAWSYLGLALMALPTNLEGLRTSPGKVLGSCFGLLSAVLLYGLVFPRIAYNNVFEQTQIDTLYVASMPSFQYSQYDSEIMHWAYYLLALSFLPIIVARLLPAPQPSPAGGSSKAGLQEKSSASKTNIKASSSAWRGRAGVGVVLLLLAGSYVFLQSRWYHNDQFQREMTMMRCVEDENWEGVLDAAPAWNDLDTLHTPTRAMVMMKNLALFRLGRAGNEMFQYLEGAQDQRMDSLTVRMTQVGGKLLYYNYGKLNFCYRWCMEDGVEFGWKVEHLKFMARCALLKGEWEVAKKYLNQLRLTRNHREWAEKYLPYVGHPELMAQDPAMAPICKLKEFGDRLDGDNTLVELYLLRTFANGHGADVVYQEATLLCSLIMKDIDLFWPRLLEYVQMHRNEPNFRMPRHFQEAALLYSMLEPGRPSYMWPGMTNQQALQKMPIDESVKRSYNDFMAFNGRADIAPLSEPEKRVVFQPMFGNTFYYFYFLVRGQKTN